MSMLQWEGEINTINKQTVYVIAEYDVDTSTNLPIITHLVAYDAVDSKVEVDKDLYNRVEAAIDDYYENYAA